MIESCQQTRSPTSARAAIEFHDDTFVVDAALIGELLHLPASHVSSLMRAGRITSACEQGIDEHAGEFRLSFFYRNRRARAEHRSGRPCPSQIDHRFRRSSDPGTPHRPVAQDEDLA